MRDRHTTANRRGSKAFALHNGAANIFSVFFQNPADFYQFANEGANGVLLGGSLEVVDQGTFNKKLTQAHARASLGTLAITQITRNFPGGNVTSVILNLFLVPANLHGNLVHGQIDCRNEFRVRLARHEIVFVFGLNQKLNQIIASLMIDRYFNHGQTVEKVVEPICLFPDAVLHVVIDVAMTC
jgi:hypothetical protein